MKAFIFNSGAGSRMGELTKEKPKALVELSNGETILSRQIRLLKQSGITDIIISTGPFENKIVELTNQFSDISFEFVNNPIYKETNSIYSLFLSKNLINDDFIVMHGDLVFDSLIVQEILNDPRENLCLVNTETAQPEKDFKGRIVDFLLQEISVNIFDSNCYALQPLYKLSSHIMHLWLNQIEKYVEDGMTKVYAENALNDILLSVKIEYLDYKNFYIEEIDNVEDLKRVSNQFRQHDYKNQAIVTSTNYISLIEEYIKNRGIKKPLVVHGKHLSKDLQFSDFLKRMNYPTFTGYSPNPTYEEVLEGLDLFKIKACDGIIAIGGGSCIDVAKAIKLYSVYDDNYIEQEFKYVNLPLIVAPTTAGTGSESTRFSVIYYKGEKQSLVNDSLLPDYVILNEHFLNDIPEYHKKSALLDAFCQAIEAYWSINSNDQSKQYSEKALKLIINNYKKYLDKDTSVYRDILIAANYAGKAINIAQTTAPHAMSYKLTSIANIAHGHAVSILLPYVTMYMVENIDEFTDIRGLGYIKDMFDDLSRIFKTDIKNLHNKIEEIIKDIDLNKPKVNENDVMNMTTSVNLERLKNSPITIDKNAISFIYSRALLNHY